MEEHYRLNADKKYYVSLESRVKFTPLKIHALTVLQVFQKAIKKKSSDLNKVQP